MKKVIFVLLIISFAIVTGSNVILAESIHDIAKIGSVEEMKVLLEAEIDINEYHDGVTPLMLAAKHNNLEMIELLLDNDANIYLRDHYSDIPLVLFAAENEDLEVIKKLADEGMDIFAYDNWNINALMLAADRNKNMDVIKFLLDKGVSLTAFDNWGTSVFSRAVSNDNPESLRLILEAGKDIENEDERRLLYQAGFDEAISQNNLEAIDLLVQEEEILDNRESLMRVFENSQFDIAKELIKNDANVNSRDEDGRTPLMYAIVFDFELDLIEKMIQNGANVNSRTLLGTTPLMEAAFYTNKDYVKLLLDNGANLKAKDNIDNNVLIYASANEDNEVLEFILQQEEIEINWKNSNRENALIFAIKLNQNIEAAKTLIDSGINIDITIDDKNKTPLMVSIEESRKDITELLLNNGADGTVKDSDGRTAFNYAEDVFSFQGTDVFWELNDAQW